MLLVQRTTIFAIPAEQTGERTLSSFTTALGHELSLTVLGGVVPKKALLQMGGALAQELCALLLTVNSKFPRVGVHF